MTDARSAAESSPSSSSNEKDVTRTTAYYHILYEHVKGWTSEWLSQTPEVWFGASQKRNRKFYQNLNTTWGLKSLVAKLGDEADRREVAVAEERRCARTTATTTRGCRSAGLCEDPDSEDTSTARATSCIETLLTQLVASTKHGNFVLLKQLLALACFLDQQPRNERGHHLQPGVELQHSVGGDADADVVDKHEGASRLIQPIPSLDFWENLSQSCGRALRDDFLSKNQDEDDHDFDVMDYFMDLFLFVDNDALAQGNGQDETTDKEQQVEQFHLLLIFLTVNWRHSRCLKATRLADKFIFQYVLAMQAASTSTTWSTSSEIKCHKFALRVYEENSRALARLRDMEFVEQALSDATFPILEDYRVGCGGASPSGTEGFAGRGPFLHDGDYSKTLAPKTLPWLSSDFLVADHDQRERYARPAWRKPEAEPLLRSLLDKLEDVNNSSQDGRPRQCLLSFSAGVDSTACACLLSAFQEMSAWACLYLQYPNRGELEAAAELSWVRAACRKLKAPLFWFRMDLLRPHQEQVVQVQQEEDAGDEKEHVANAAFPGGVSCEISGLSREEYEKYTRDIRFHMYRQAWKLFIEGRKDGCESGRQKEQEGDQDRGHHDQDQDQDNLPCILLGHHEDDCDENRIENLTRGHLLCRDHGGADGMVVSRVLGGVRLWRPYVTGTRKQEFLDLLEALKFPYLRDSTPAWSVRGVIRKTLDAIVKVEAKDHAGSSRFSSPDRITKHREEEQDITSNILVGSSPSTTAETTPSSLLKRSPEQDRVVGRDHSCSNTGIRSPEQVVGRDHSCSNTGIRSLLSQYSGLSATLASRLKTLENECCNPKMCMLSIPAKSSAKIRVFLLDLSRLRSRFRDTDCASPMVILRKVVSAIAKKWNSQLDEQQTAATAPTESSMTEEMLRIKIFENDSPVGRRSRDDRMMKVEQEQEDNDLSHLLHQIVCRGAVMLDDEVPVTPLLSCPPSLLASQKNTPRIKVRRGVHLQAHPEPQQERPDGEIKPAQGEQRERPDGEIKPAQGREQSQASPAQGEQSSSRNHAQGEQREQSQASRRNSLILNKKAVQHMWQNIRDSKKPVSGGGLVEGLGYLHCKQGEGPQGGLGLEFVILYKGDLKDRRADIVKYAKQHLDSIAG
ncbi:unnamed protein product [Amoebophrya sp. A25]|nr:unnamed protein product [Amoebophrya sp. A25]|eukprot:GSA25T00017064001.1